MNDYLNKGFTLLELSIVMVIIGLIIGGITVGQDLVRAAEIGAVVNEANKYKVAFNTFKLKYNAVPGDMDNAQSYWTSCIDAGADTCNGDGNGKVETSKETRRGWQHLSLSEIIPGQYTGFWNGGVTAGENYPGSIYGKDSVYDFTYTGTVNSHIVIWGKVRSDQGSARSSIIAQEYARIIEDKYDDGDPHRGHIRIARGEENVNNCVDSGGWNLGSLQSQTIDCYVYWVMKHY